MNKAIFLATPNWSKPDLNAYLAWSHTQKRGGVVYINNYTLKFTVLFWFQDLMLESRKAVLFLSMRVLFNPVFSRCHFPFSL